MTVESGFILAGIALAWAAGYFVACWWWPWAKCKKCEGRGRFDSPSGKYWRNCRRCGGGGRRVRTGRRVWTWFFGKGSSEV